MVIGLTGTWLFYSMEVWLAKLFRLVFPDHLYLPGMGLAAGIGLAFLVGLLMETRAMQVVFGVWDHLLQRIPLVKSVYGAVQDIIGTFSTERSKRYNRVVVVHFKEFNTRLLGFVTQEDVGVLGLGIPTEGSVAVYLPMSYQIGGYFIVVPKTMVEPLEMSVEDASRLILTAGMSSKKT